MPPAGALRFAYGSAPRPRPHRNPLSVRSNQDFCSYAARAGIEGTHAQAIHRCGLRRYRYIGLAKAHLQHVITAATVNLVRVAEWFAGTPVAETRCSRFAALRAAA